MNKQQRKKRNQEWFSGEINKSDNPPSTKKSDKPITRLKREEGKERERRRRKHKLADQK